METSSWVSQREAAFALGTSERTLHRMRSDETLTAGKCWRRKIPHNKNSHVLYILEACNAALSCAATAQQMESDQLFQLRAIEVGEA